MKKRGILATLALCAAPVFVQAVNEGATVTAPFMAVPPVIDGVVSAGEWDAAATAPGQWSDHGSATAEDNTQPTSVKVAYSITGLYILFECVDDIVLAAAGGSERYASGPTGAPGMAQPFTFGGSTDYLATYIDPTNYPDDAPSATSFSYSIQAEPAVSFTDGEETESYTYTEVGAFGGFRARFLPPLVVDGVEHYWANGISWELEDSKLVDGPTANGYVMEWFIAWSDLSGYFTNWASVVDVFADADLDATVPFNAANGIVRTLQVDDATGAIGFPGHGAVTGMPVPGTTWKIQFCRYSQESVPSYVNWVGDVGGFASRPFGNLVFGAAEPTAVRDAILHAAGN